MTHDEAKAALIKVLQKVQSISGLPCPALGNNDLPKNVLPEFDSTVWPVATTWVAKELDVIIENDVHIFGGRDKGALLTISQTADLICKKHKKKLAEMAVAAE